MIRKDARAVVTGAGSGLGAALCTQLAQRGAKIIAADIDLEAATATATRLGSDVHPVKCDVSSLADVEALADETERLLGGIDLLVNNAGVAVAGQMGEVPIADWRWIVDINLWGVIHGCHVFVPWMRAQKSGNVLNVSSAAGLLSPPRMAPYNTTKAAIIALSETLHADLEPDGVGVTVLCPTFFPTNLTQSKRTAPDEKTRRAAQRLVAKGGWTADEIARAALAGVDANELYVAPQLDGRWLWRLKRLAPKRFNKLSKYAVPLLLGR